MHHTGGTRRPQRRWRGSVVIEFWFYFVLWLGLTGTAVQVILTTNRQVYINYYAFLSARAYMGQPNDSKGKDWVTYVRNYYENWGLENRLMASKRLLPPADLGAIMSFGYGSFEHKSSVKDGLPGVLVTDYYPQHWAGIIRMSYFMGSVVSLFSPSLAKTFDNYPYYIKMNSWAFTAKCPVDEQESGGDNNRDDYEGYQGIASSVNQLMSAINGVMGMF